MRKQNDWAGKLPAMLRRTPETAALGSEEAAGGFVTKLPVRLGYVYLAVPMYIFLFGWLKAAAALLMAVVLTVGLVLAWRDAPALRIPRGREAMLQQVGVVALAMLWVFLSGIGGFAFQNYDHMWRSAILEKLVTCDWPVIVTDTGEYFSRPVALIYYFAIWLPSACVGKLWGLRAAHVFLYWWCTAGVVLIFTLLQSRFRRFSLPLLVVFVMFSGLDAVGDFILNNSPNFLWFATHHIENWAFGFQMSSLSTQLFWVFNQAIPAWLITLLLLCQRDNRSVIFIYSFSFLSCTLPAIGLVPILGCIGIERIVKSVDKARPVRENVRTIAAEALTVQNVCTGLLVTLVSGLFLTSNSTGNSGFRSADMPNLLMSYLLFVALEFVVYYLAIYPQQKRRPLYWVTLYTLLVVPLICFGPHVDFVMRASIPSLIVLFVMIAETLQAHSAAKRWVPLAVLSVLLLLGSFTAYHEIMRSVTKTIAHARDPEVVITANEIDLFEDGQRNNFFGEYEDSLFFNLFVKVK